MDNRATNKSQKDEWCDATLWPRVMSSQYHANSGLSTLSLENHKLILLSELFWKLLRTQPWKEWMPHHLKWLKLKNCAVVHRCNIVDFYTMSPLHQTVVFFVTFFKPQCCSVAALRLIQSRSDADVTDVEIHNSVCLNCYSMTFLNFTYSDGVKFRGPIQICFYFLLICP